MKFKLFILIIILSQLLISKVFSANSKDKLIVNDTIVLKTMDYKLIKNENNYFIIKITNKNIDNKLRNKFNTQTMFKIEFDNLILIAKFRDVGSSVITPDCNLMFFSFLLNTISFRKINSQDYSAKIGDTIILNSNDFILKSDDIKVLSIEVVNKLNEINSKRNPVILIEIDNIKYIAKGLYIFDSELPSNCDMYYRIDELEFPVMRENCISFRKIK